MDLKLNAMIHAWRNIEKPCSTIAEFALIKYFKSIPELHMKTGGFFKFRHETFLAYCEQLLDSTINALLYWT